MSIPIMTGFGFTILMCLSCMSFQCEGAITSPAKGTEFVFLPGSTGNLTWTFDDDVSTLTVRAWVFTRSGGSTSERLATVVDDDNPKIRKSSLSGVEIVKPATLLLKSVNQSYDGVYKFELVGSGPAVSNDVRVFIAKKPTVTFSCSSPVRVIEGDDVSCVCTGEDGVPAPANVTWYKDGVQIAEAKKENNTLTLTDVNVTDSGTYKCVAQSYPTDAYKDEKSIQIMVNVSYTTLQPSNSTTLQTSTATTPQPSSPSSNATKVTTTGTSDASSGTEWYIVMVSLVSGIFLALSLV